MLRLPGSCCPCRLPSPWPVGSRQAMLITNIPFDLADSETQLALLESLRSRFSSNGLVVLAFPCNQFAKESSTATEADMRAALVRDGVTFPVMEPVAVNGQGASPLFAYLKRKLAGPRGVFVESNFEKFLVDREGRPIARFPENSDLRALEKALLTCMGPNSTEDLTQLAAWDSSRIADPLAVPIEPPIKSVAAARALREGTLKGGTRSPLLDRSNAAKPPAGHMQKPQIVFPASPYGAPLKEVLTPYGGPLKDVLTPKQTTPYSLKDALLGTNGSRHAVPNVYAVTPVRPSVPKELFPPATPQTPGAALDVLKILETPQRDDETSGTEDTESAPASKPIAMPLSPDALAMVSRLMDTKLQKFEQQLAASQSSSALPSPGASLRGPSMPAPAPLATARGPVSALPPSAVPALPTSAASPTRDQLSPSRPAPPYPIAFPPAPALRGAPGTLAARLADPALSSPASARGPAAGAPIFNTPALEAQFAALLGVSRLSNASDVAAPAAGASRMSASNVNTTASTGTPPSVNTSLAYSTPPSTNTSLVRGASRSFMRAGNSIRSTVV
eukprot:m.28349 g.28349  ORF g.28349 m.28349 type:complete len:562 (-) comp4546_c0_seq1:425-2110(-)